MKRLFFVGLLLFLIGAKSASSQQYVNKSRFFSDTSIVNASLTFNLKNIHSNRSKEGYIFPAVFACKIGDSLNVKDAVSLEIRGHFRRGYCYVPPLKVIFKNNPSAAFYHLKSLKLVNACMIAKDYDQYLLKEYLCYKLYNLITDKSFRVRLLNLSYCDSAGKKKTVTQHAFLLEDIKELAKRNDFSEWTGGNMATEACNRRQTTIVSIFEYMIGNTDWSIAVQHNIKLIVPNNNLKSRPYAIPYDLDYSGMVNATYAIPDERLGIQSVRDRDYRGFPRTMEELNDVLDIFKKQKDNIYATVNNFSLLTTWSRTEMITYLDEFYAQINSPAEVKSVFIDNARQQ